MDRVSIRVYIVTLRGVANDEAVDPSISTSEGSELHETSKDLFDDYAHHPRGGSARTALGQIQFTNVVNGGSYNYLAGTSWFGGAVPTLANIGLSPTTTPTR